MSNPFALLLFMLAIINAKKTPPNALPQGSTLPQATVTCQRPYTVDSPWNTKLTSPVYHPRSTELANAMTGAFGVDPTQYTYPVYEVTNVTPHKTLTYSGTFSDVKNAGLTLERDSRGGSISLPIPSNAKASSGNDSQLIIVNTDTGDEWGFYEASPNPDGTWRATNGYHYNTRWSGVAPAGFGSRGAGVPYLAGLIRPCEIAQGHIDHAIAFGYQYTLPSYISPATKSDGKSTNPNGLPEGARLQLKQDATEAEIKSWCTGDPRINERTCRTIVRALQDYGMILIDTSGHPKLYAESAITAAWTGILENKTVSKIPYSAIRVIRF